MTYAVSEIVGEHHVARERVGEGVIEGEHLEQIAALDQVQVAVGESAHVGGRLADGGLLPEEVAEHVALAEYGDHLVVLDDLERAVGDEVERVEALAAVVNDVAGRTVVGGEVNGELAEAAVARQPKRRMLVEDLAVEVHAYVGLHVLGHVVEHLGRIDALGHRPRRDHVVHDALVQLLGHVVQLHELADVVDHLGVAAARRRELTDHARHLAEYGRVHERCQIANEHLKMCVSFWASFLFVCVCAHRQETS